MAAKSPYEVLGVSSSVSQADLKKQYRKLLLALHPDKHGAQEPDPSKFQEVQQAWTTVGTPASRATYDRTQSSESYESH